MRSPFALVPILDVGLFAVVRVQLCCFCIALLSVDGWCGFQCNCVDGGDYRDGVFDDFVELNHLELFLRRINLPPT